VSGKTIAFIGLLSAIGTHGKRHSHRIRRECLISLMLGMLLARAYAVSGRKKWVAVILGILLLTYLGLILVQ